MLNRTIFGIMLLMAVFMTIYAERAGVNAFYVVGYFLMVFTFMLIIMFLDNQNKKL